MKQNNHTHPSANKTLASTLFHGTHDYYATYRPGIPVDVINIIVQHLNILTTDRILDLGCGTGQMAVAMQGRCRDMVCLDADADMIRLAQQTVAPHSNINITWIHADTKDLAKINAEPGSFKAATISRAFHWMDQVQVLRDLDFFIGENGGLSILGDKSIWTGDEDWQNAVKKVVQKYLGEKRRVAEGSFEASRESWEKLIARSAFSKVVTKHVSVQRTWDPDSILGWLFSSSFASPHLFGNRVGAFEEDIKKTLLSLNPQGQFKEDALFQIILATRT